MSDNPLSTRIKKLSPLLINQLAAGEVITRPAAVVKELLENAVDAGATLIEIYITQSGMGMIEVIDNGSGIHPDDMIMAVTRHATSKVADIAHLHGISTLGFRGEALAATAAVSRLTLSSSHDDSGIGRQLQVAGVLADTPKLIPVVHQRGTTITVKDLYFNLPARRSNIKSLATEFMHIETIVREVAIACADVTLILYHDQKKRLHLGASTVGGANEFTTSHLLPLPRLEQALGIALEHQALEILVDLNNLVSQTSAKSEHIAHSNSLSEAKIVGWIWPNQDKMAGLPKLLYVNGRLIKDSAISNQLKQVASSAGYESLYYALYFELPCEWLNLNVHPSKQRIKISPLNNILAHLGHVVRSTLSRLPIPSALAANLSTISGPIDTQPYSPSTYLAQAPTSVQAPTDQYSALPTINNSAIDHDYSLVQTNLYEEDSYTSSNSNKHSIDSAVHLDHPISLPLCLDVIHNAKDNWQLEDDIDSSLPWLLMFHQGQLLLISEEDWYTHINALFDFNPLDHVSTADSINQHLNQGAKQMSVPDLRAFNLDISHILRSFAIKAINTSEFLTLLLAASITSS